jgi:hypothetical protein
MAHGSTRRVKTVSGKDRRLLFAINYGWWLACSLLPVIVIAAIILGSPSIKTGHDTGVWVGTALLILAVFAQPHLVGWTRRMIAANRNNH